MKNWYYGTGRRKTSSAKVFLKKWKETIIIVNDKKIDEYFFSNKKYKKILEIIETIKLKNKLKIKIKIKGGGKNSQINAIKMGLARALINYKVKLKKFLKSNKLLTRDSRMVERKKVGHKKSRKSKQYSKR